MKVSTLAVLSVISFSQAYAFDISTSCDITRNQIKDALNQSSLSIREEERKVLRGLQPQIDQIKLNDLIQDVKDTEYYNYTWFGDDELNKKLRNLQIKKMHQQNLLAYKALEVKSYLTESELESLHYLAKEIKKSKNDGIKPMTEDEETEFSTLAAYAVEHERRSQKRAEAILNLNNYIRSEVLNKVSNSGGVTGFANDGAIDAYNFHFPNGFFDKINLSYQTPPDQDIYNPRGDSDLYYPTKYNLHYFEVRNFGSIVFSDGKSMDFAYESYKSKNKEDRNEFSKILKDIALNTKKTLNDFGLNGDKYVDTEEEKEIVDILGDVKSSLDLATGKITVGFKTRIFNKKWSESFPSDYVSLDEMTELLMPKECRSEVKEVSTNTSVSDVSREDNKKSDAPEPKKGFSKILFGGKKASNQ